jgi:hypothetical protein
MNKDKALEDLFLAQKPCFDDREAFMASLTKRLDTVEYIKQHQEAILRRYKTFMVVAFLVGIISGAATLMYILSTPADVPIFSFHVKSGFFLWLAENSRLITTTTLSLLMTFGLLSIYNNVVNILDMRKTAILT